MSWRYPVPDPACPECGESVPYRDRTKCRKCGRWCHGGCCVRRKKCMPCAGLKGIVDSLADELELNDSQRVTALVVVAALRIGADVERVVEATGLRREFVESKARNLEESGIWKDGHLLLEAPDPECLDKEWVEFILVILCADGQVVRRPSTASVEA